VLTYADFPQASTVHEKMSWWLSFLPLLFQKREQAFKICSTTIVRRLPSGMVLIVAAFPKSANSTTIECNVFASSSPTEAKLDELKTHTSAELDSFVANALDNYSQGTSSSFAESFPWQTERNELLRMHLDSEKRAGAEIHPAARSQNFSMEGKADDDCKKSLLMMDSFLTSFCSLQGARRQSGVSVQC